VVTLATIPTLSLPITVIMKRLDVMKYLLWVLLFSAG